MRLWHIDLIKNGLLPKSQLLGQWRELNSIFKKQDRHILINYVYNYHRKYLRAYADAVLHEMKRRHYKVMSMDNYKSFFKYVDKPDDTERFDEHNDEYLLICFMNLLEKFLREQKDFDKETFDKLYDFVNTKFDLRKLGVKKNVGD